MFFTPEIYGSHNYMIDVNIDDVNACREMYPENCQDYSEDLEELVRLINRIICLLQMREKLLH